MTRGFNLDPKPIRQIAFILMLAAGLLVFATVAASVWIGTRVLVSNPTPQTIYVFTTPQPTASPAATLTPSPTPAATPGATGTPGA